MLPCFGAGEATKSRVVWDSGCAASVGVGPGRNRAEDGKDNFLRMICWLL